MKWVQILLFLFPIRKHKVNEQEKKLSSVDVQFKRLFLLRFPSFLLSSELIFTAAFVSSLFILSSWFYFAPLLKKKKRKRKRVWYFLHYAINFRCSHPLPLSLVFLCSGSLRKKKKFIVKSDIFVAVLFFCVSILSF